LQRVRRWSRLTILITQGTNMTDSNDLGSPGPGTSTRAFTETARITGDTQRITISSGGYEQSGLMDNVRASTADLNPRGDGSNGILSTARSTAGRPLSGSEIRPNTRVIIPGAGETTAAAAAAAGYLTRNSDGSYSEVAGSTSEPQGQPGQPGQQQDQPDAAPAKVADLSGDAHTWATQFAEQVGNIDLEHGVSDVIETGALSQDALARIAGAMSLEPGEVTNRVATIQAAYRAQANEMVGDAAEAIFAYANQHDRAALRKAVDQHVKYEDPTAYDGIVRNFWMNLSPEAILNAQNASALNARRESNGTVTIQTKDMPSRMSWGGAVRAGYVGKGR
jgi:hypothetical protein